MSIVQINSKIDKVKVYAIGSTVTRFATLSQLTEQIPEQGANNAPDRHKIAVEIVGLPLALDDASVRVRVDTSESSDRLVDQSIIVTDVRVGLSVPPPPPVTQSSLEAEIQAAQVEVDRLQDLRNTLELETQILQKLNVPDRPNGEDGKAPPTSPTGARLALANFKDEQQKLRLQEIRELAQKLRQAQENLADLQQKQAIASNANVAKEHELRKTIIAHLHFRDRPSSESLANLQLVVEYYVNGARWTPSYVCRLDSVTNQAAIAVRALICQRTGEDWAGVRLELSTATPTGWCELPELPSLRLGRSQTYSPQKAWRNPPQGSELLFADYDYQKQNARNAIGANFHLPNFKIPQVAPLKNIQKSNLSEKVERLGDLEWQAAYEEYELEQIRYSSDQDFVDSESSDGSVLTSKLDDDSSVKTFATVPKFMPASMPVPTSVPRKAVRAAAPQSAERSRMMGMQELSAQSQVPISDYREDTLISAAIFDPREEIKNYGLMRLAEPSNLELRGKLNLPNPKTLYLESLQRRQITVNFEIERIIQNALDRATCRETRLPDGGINVRQTAGAFDFAYLGNGRVDIPADGQFHSVALLQESAEIDLRYIVVPREDTNVFRIAQLRNPLRAPLLAGAADIYVNGEYILSTKIATVPPKGQMELALGVEQAIKVARNTSFKEMRSGMSLVAFNELRHHIQIAIANRLGREAKIEVRERIPQPQPDAKVDVTVTQVTPTWEKYEQQERNAPIKGGYRWQINVAAGSETELNVDYTIKIFVDNELVNGNRREE